ncbi:DUF305 domain-containing protein [Actinocorallia longicatena]|uniref:DUF305 domain-containing protein n=1 Tax=Actinocorallia longicatena TaxID=111803 RepID=A0ABP6QKB7_9ACTN
MTWTPRRPGRVFSAVAFTVIGAVAALLLTAAGALPRDRERLPAAGPVDIGFSQDMIVHHQQAVTMAQAVLGRVSPSVAQLATGVELNQIREIGQMQGWLNLWDAPQVSSGPAMTWMSGHQGHGGADDSGADDSDADDGAMPGLASVDEMNRLGELEGDDLDAYFLQLMIRHHEGGLVMTAAAARDATDPHVRAFAVIIATEQRQETATMSGLLSALGREPLPLSG